MTETPPLPPSSIGDSLTPTRKSPRQGRSKASTPHRSPRVGSQKSRKIKPSIPQQPEISLGPGLEDEEGDEGTISDVDEGTGDDLEVPDRQPDDDFDDVHPTSSLGVAPVYSSVKGPNQGDRRERTATRHKQPLLDAVQEVEKKVSEVGEGLTKKLQETVDSLMRRVDRHEASLKDIDVGLQTLCWVIVNDVKPRGVGRNRMDIILHRMKDKELFEGQVYHRVFCTLFCKTIMQDVSNQESTNASGAVDIDGRMEKAVVDVGEFVKSLMFTVHPSERSQGNVTGGTHATKLRTFRKYLTWALIRTVGQNKVIGIYERKMVPVGEGKQFSRPFWMEKGFVKKKHLNNVFDREDADLRGVSTKGVRKRKLDGDEKSFVLGALRERDEIAEEIVRRLNYSHTIHFNKVRELTRQSFFKEIGFIWEEGFTYEAEKVPSSRLPFIVDDVPCSDIATSAIDCENHLKNNQQKWEDLVKDTSKDMSFLVSYEVQVPTEGNPHVKETRKLVRCINALKSSYEIIMRMTGTQKADDFMVYHKSSLKVVYLFSCLIRHALMRKLGGYGEFHLSASVDVDDVVQVMCPPSSKTRKDILLKYVTEISQEEYERRNVATDMGMEVDIQPSNIGNDGFVDLRNRSDDDEDGEDSDEDMNNMFNNTFYA